MGRDGRVDRRAVHPRPLLHPRRPRAYLSAGLSTILAFMGVKLLLHFGHLQDDGIPEIGTGASLAVIAVVLVITVTASLWKARREPETRAHAGSLRETRGDVDDG